MNNATQLIYKKNRRWLGRWWSREIRGACVPGCNERCGWNILGTGWETAMRDTEYRTPTGPIPPDKLARGLSPYKMIPRFSSSSIIHCSNLNRGRGGYYSHREKTHSAKTAPLLSILTNIRPGHVLIHSTTCQDNHRVNSECLQASGSGLRPPVQNTEPKTD